MLIGMTGMTSLPMRPADRVPGSPKTPGGGRPEGRPPPGGGGGTWRQAPVALPATHWFQSMFQPLRPLSGETVLSLEFFTTTTSPIWELS